MTIHVSIVLVMNLLSSFVLMGVITHFGDKDFGLAERILETIRMYMLKHNEL